MTDKYKAERDELGGIIIAMRDVELRITNLTNRRESAERVRLPAIERARLNMIQATITQRRKEIERIFGRSLGWQKIEERSAAINDEAELMK